MGRRGGRGAESDQRGETGVAPREVGGPSLRRTSPGLSPSFYSEPLAPSGVWKPPRRQRFPSLRPAFQESLDPRTSGKGGRRDGPGGPFRPRGFPVTREGVNRGSDLPVSLSRRIKVSTKEGHLRPIKGTPDVLFSRDVCLRARLFNRKFSLSLRLEKTSLLTPLVGWGGGQPSGHPGSPRTHGATDYGRRGGDVCWSRGDFSSLTRQSWGGRTCSPPAGSIPPTSRTPGSPRLPGPEIDGKDRVVVDRCLGTVPAPTDPTQVHIHPGVTQTKSSVSRTGVESLSPQPPEDVLVPPPHGVSGNDVTPGSSVRLHCPRHRNTVPTPLTPNRSPSPEGATTRSRVYRGKDNLSR